MKTKFLENISAKKVLKIVDGEEPNSSTYYFKNFKVRIFTFGTGAFFYRLNGMSLFYLTTREKFWRLLK